MHAVEHGKRRDGEREADFINVVAWRQLAGVVGEHLTKGRLVGVTGRLQVFSQENGDGTWRTTAEVVADQVVFLDARRKSDRQPVVRDEGEAARPSPSLRPEETHKAKGYPALHLSLPLQNRTGLRMLGLGT